MLKHNLASLSPFALIFVMGCGSSSSAAFDDNGGDAATDDTSAGGGDTSGGGGDTSGGGGDTSGGGDTGGGGSDTSTGTDATGSDTAVSPTDTSVPPTDTATCVGTVCSGVCTDLRVDPKNCGACGTEVCHDEACAGGKPACVPGYRRCPTAGSSCLGCVSPTDPNNCGACGVKCTSTQVCTATGGGGGIRCVDSTTCGGGATNCSGACTFLAVDQNNCGACGKVCSPGQFCTGGVCTSYTPAPGCTTCPCTACATGTTCCRYVDGFVCSAGKCPAG